MRYNDLKIRVKLLSGFALVTLIALIIGVIGLFGINSINHSFLGVTDTRMPGIQYLGVMEANLERVQKGYIQLLDNQLSRADRERILSEISSARAEYRKAHEQFGEIAQSEEGALLCDELIKEIAAWRNINTQQIDPLHAEVMAIDLLNPMQVNRDLEQFMKDHYALQVQTVAAIQNLRNFEGGDDATRCNFGQWLPNFRTSNPSINANMRDMMSYHDSFHAAVHRIKQLIAQGSRDAAMRHFNEAMVPAAEGVFNYFALINQEAQRAVQNFEEMNRQITHISVTYHGRIMDLIGRIIQLNNQMAHEDVNRGNRVATASNIMVIAGIGIGIVLALAMALLITRLITTGMNKGVGLAQRISQGDLTVNIDQQFLEQKDEVGQMAQALQLMVEKLREVIGSVVIGSDNIAAASQQMSSTAQEMSQGSTEQASSAEEASSSMEEMAANIQQNTENSRATEHIARQAEKGIIEGNEASQKAVEAMKEIAEKISIIGEISRQTNILALNAAVEAARAGEHGRGFAVVAAEVRKLAERSQVAAGEIDRLSKYGVEISAQAGQKLEAIIPDIQRTARLVQEIAAASVEQNAGADQVNAAIQQLNHVTQQNAAASEEMATSSEELSNQADQLLEIVSYFKLDTQGSKGQHDRKKSFIAAKNPVKKPTIGKTNGNGWDHKPNKGAKIVMSAEGTKFNDQDYEKF